MRRKTICILLAATFALAGLIFPPADGQDAADTAKDALDKAVETGKKLFNDKKFGTNGKACADCHANPDKKKLHLKDRVGDYPKYDRREKRVITLGTKLNQMIERMLKGKEETLGSDRLVAIEAYLMDLNRGK
jgi:cytochrome c